MSKSRLQDVYDTLKIAAAAAINADPNTAAYGGQVTDGQPIQAELEKILEAKHYVVSVFQRGMSRDTTRYADEEIQLIPAPAPLAGSIAGNMLTLSGSVVAGLNVSVFAGAQLHAVYVTTTVGQQLADVAIAVAAAVNAAGLAGVVASASGAQISVAGTPSLLCNIGSVGAIAAQEVKRTERSIDVAVWAPDPVVRAAVAGAIESGLGTTDEIFLTLSDGTGLHVWPNGDVPIDKGQSSYSLYEHHFVFAVENGIYRITEGATVQAVRSSMSLGPGVLEVDATLTTSDAAGVESTVTIVS